MPNYIRKPIEVEAFQVKENGLLQTSKGSVPVKAGDWCVTYPDGRIAAVKAATFLANFEIKEEITPEHQDDFYDDELIGFSLG